MKKKGNVGTAYVKLWCQSGRENRERVE